MKISAERESRDELKMKQQDVIGKPTRSKRNLIENGNYFLRLKFYSLKFKITSINCQIG